MKAKGSTTAERYLAQLAERTFLSLWCYPEVYRDEGQVKKGGDGQEVCDLLVVFGEHVLIFSDKACEYKEYKNEVLSWTRWYRKAILESAEQAWGAESWLRRHPTRVFCDRRCQVPLPVTLPAPEKIKFHRLVVAHNITAPARSALGGSGSLKIDTLIQGKAHYEQQQESTPIQPFTVGFVDKQRGFVHVLDNVSLDILLQNLDTITDFVEYLEKKESFLHKAAFQVVADGEQDLLAFYLSDVGEDERHDFVVEDGDFSQVSLEAGHWEKFAAGATYLRQQARDEISYAWDRLIEVVAHHFSEKSLYFSSHPSFEAIELQLRLLAQESRFSRRMLATMMASLAEKFKAVDVPYATRVYFSETSPGICYVFFIFSPKNANSYDEYRQMRRGFLQAICLIAKLKFFGPLHYIIGIGSETGGIEAFDSYDILAYEAYQWEPGEKEKAVSMQQQLPFLKNTQWHRGSEEEYPD